MSLEDTLESFDYSFVKRIHAAQQAVHNQILYLDEQWGVAESQFKDDASRVTEVDCNISKGILEELGVQFESDAFCSEEAEDPKEVLSLENKYSWILDPIDGTNNYALGMPACAIALALLKNGVPVYGIVYDMSRDIIVQGGPDIGTYDGNKLVEVKDGRLDDQSLMCLHFPLCEADLARVSPMLAKYKVRSLGSAVLHFIYAATGRTNGAISFNLSLWDMAACYPIMLGAKGMMLFEQESPFPLSEFSVQGPKYVYWGGSMAFCDEISKALN